MELRSKRKLNISNPPPPQKVLKEDSFHRSPYNFPIVTTFETPYRDPNNIELDSDSEVDREIEETTSTMNSNEQIEGRQAPSNDNNDNERPHSINSFNSTSPGVYGHFMDEHMRTILIGPPQRNIAPPRSSMSGNSNVVPMVIDTSII